jgi:hypothetical protein
MINNKKVRLSPTQYRNQMKNYVESTNETEWISPSRVRMKTVKEYRRNYANSDSIDDYVRNETGGASTSFQRT